MASYTIIRHSQRIEIRNGNIANNNVIEPDIFKVETSNKSSKQSFKERIQQVSENNPPYTRPLGFIAEICCLIWCFVPVASCGLCVIALEIALSNLLATVTIVIGALYNERKYCPVENISLMLIIGGSIMLVHTLLGSISNCIVVIQQRGRVAGAPEASPPGCLSWAIGFFRLALLCWFIAACVTVYLVYWRVSDDVHSGNYCHPLLYLYAFWFVTLPLAALAVGLVLFVIALCFTCCVACFMYHCNSQISINVNNGEDTNTNV